MPLQALPLPSAHSLPEPPRKRDRPSQQGDGESEGAVKRWVRDITTCKGVTSWGACSTRAPGVRQGRHAL